jgi:hypothetical protein
MRSFAEHRKLEIKSRIYLVGIKEAIDHQFDALRIELSEALKLPPLDFDFMFVENVMYEKARQEDYAEVRAILESVIQYCKTNFYHALLAEATAAASAAVSVKDLEEKLMGDMTRMLGELKQKVLALLGSQRTTTDFSTDVGDSNLAATGSSAGNQTRAPSGLGANRMGGSRPTPAGTNRRSVASVPSPAGAASPASGYRGHDGSDLGFDTDSGAVPASSFQQGRRPVRGPYDWHAVGEERPVDPKTGERPAPYWSLFPKDGFLAGLGRVIGAPIRWLTRPIRRWYFNDPTRDMRKEHVDFIENMILENTAEIERVFDDFISQFLTFAQARIKDIIGAATGSPAASGTTATGSGGVPSTGGALGVLPAEKFSDPNVDNSNRAAQQTGAQTSDQKAGTDPNAVLDPAVSQNLQQKAEQGDEVAQDMIDSILQNIDAACSTLQIGYEPKYNRRWKGNSLDLTRLTIDGKPLKNLGNMIRLNRLVFERIYTMILKKPLPDYKRKAKDEQARAVHPQVVKEVAAFVGGLKYNDNSKHRILEVLLKLGAKILGKPVPPAPIRSKQAPADEKETTPNTATGTGANQGQQLPAAKGVGVDQTSQLPVDKVTGGGADQVKQLPVDKTPPGQNPIPDRLLNLIQRIEADEELRTAVIDLYGGGYEGKMQFLRWLDRNFDKGHYADNDEALFQKIVRDAQINAGYKGPAGSSSALAPDQASGAKADQVPPPKATLNQTGGNQNEAILVEKLKNEFDSMTRAGNPQAAWYVMPTDPAKLAYIKKYIQDKDFSNEIQLNAAVARVAALNAGVDPSDLDTPDVDQLDSADGGNTAQPNPADLEAAAKQGATDAVKAGNNQVTPNTDPVTLLKQEMEETRRDHEELAPFLPPPDANPLEFFPTLSELIKDKDLTDPEVRKSVLTQALVDKINADNNEAESPEPEVAGDNNNNNQPDPATLTAAAAEQGAADAAKITPKVDPVEIKPKKKNSKNKVTEPAPQTTGSDVPDNEMIEALKSLGGEGLNKAIDISPLIKAAAEGNRKIQQELEKMNIDWRALSGQQPKPSGGSILDQLKAAKAKKGGSGSIEPAPEAKSKRDRKKKDEMAPPPTTEVTPTPESAPEGESKPKSFSRRKFADWVKTREKLVKKLRGADNVERIVRAALDGDQASRKMLGSWNVNPEDFLENDQFSKIKFNRFLTEMALDPKNQAWLDKLLKAKGITPPAPAPKPTEQPPAPKATEPNPTPTAALQRSSMLDILRSIRAEKSKVEPEPLRATSDPKPAAAAKPSKVEPPTPKAVIQPPKMEPQPVRPQVQQPAAAPVVDGGEAYEQLLNDKEYGDRMEGINQIVMDAASDLVHFWASDEGKNSGDVVFDVLKNKALKAAAQKGMAEPNIPPEQAARHLASAITDLVDEELRKLCQTKGDVNTALDHLFMRQEQLKKEIEKADSYMTAKGPEIVGDIRGRQDAAADRFSSSIQDESFRGKVNKFKQLLTS